MKTTVEIHDELLIRSKRHAESTRSTLRALIEEGLRVVLANQEGDQSYVMPHCSVGDPDGEDPLESYSWQDLSEIIHGRPGGQ